MTNKHFLRNVVAIAICLAVNLGVSAQETKEAYLKLTTGAAVEYFSLTGAELLIKGNVVSIVYDGKPEMTRTFEFNKLETLEFGLRKPSAINDRQVVVFRAYVDDAGMLHLEAGQPIGQINVYSFAGALVATKKTGDTCTQINLSALPNGVYFVQAGVNRLSIIK